MMRWLRRVLLTLLGLLVIGAVLLIVLRDRVVAPESLRARIVAPLIEDALAGAGIEMPTVEVTRLTVSGADATLRAAGGALRADIGVTYSPRRLWSDRAVDTITLRGVEAELEVAANGAARLRGFDPPPGDGGGGGPLPFRRLVIDDAGLIVDTPAGRSLTMLSGSFEPDAGGRLTAEATTRGPLGEAGLDGVAGLDLTLSPDGAFRGDLRLSGLAGEAFEGSVTATLGGSSWRDALAGEVSALRAEGAVTTEELRWTLPADSSLRPFLTEEAQGSIPLRLDLALGVAVRAGSVVVSPLAERSQRIGAPGGTISLAPRGDAPYLRWTPDGTEAALTLRAGTSTLEGVIDLRAEEADGEGWRVGTTADVERLDAYGFRLADAAVTAEGRLSEAAFVLDGTLEALVASADLGVSVTDARVTSPFSLSVDRSDGRLAITLPGETCATAPRAGLALPGGTITAEPRGLRLCPTIEPLLTRAGGETRLATIVSAETAPIRVGETVIGTEGLRVALDVTADGAGAVVGARVLRAGADLPGGLAANDIRARIDIVPAEGDESVLTATLDRAVVTQDRPAPLIAPLVTAGEARLADGRVVFSGSFGTEAGRRIGTASGRHAIEDAAGGLTIDTGTLTFAPGELQPAGLLPVLSGVVGRATGSAQAELRAAWDDGEVTSGGTVTLDDLSFRGPGVAVARTAGLTGTVELDSLAPVRSAGAQSLEVGLLDLRAIQLSGGAARFTLPGDETVVIEEARFPWLGGQVGAYDTIVDFEGGGRAVLRATDLEIGEALAILDVPGLTGEGQVKATLPLSLDAFSVAIEDGTFTSTRPGVIRYRGKAAAAVADQNEQAKLAFGVLEDLRYEELSGTVDGPLAGSLQFGFTIEGTSELELPDKRVRGPVVAPVIYRLNIEAPLLQLIDQARLSTDARRQIERGLTEGRARRETEAEGEDRRD